MRTAGHRVPEGSAWTDQGALARTAALLRGTACLVPRGVYRCHSFQEAETWMTEMIRITHERQNPPTSSGSAKP